jgi:Phosphoesterase family
VGRLGAAVALVLALVAAPASASVPALSLCGNVGPPTSTIGHVIVVMLENQSFPAVIGAKSKAPYENGTLAAQCGVASEMFGATHTSAANYLAMTAGTFPPSTVRGCGSVAACSSASDNLFRQLDYSTGGWRAYEEAMPSSCYGGSAPGYKIGHNPALFYSLAGCGRFDVGVPDLTAQSGALWNDLANQSLPSFSFVTPSLSDDGEGKGSLAAADSWLHRFLSTVQQSASYQSGSTVVIVTYDEGTGSDATKGEDCTNQAKDLAGLQPSCHVAAFVVYPWASGTDPTFFDHYSVTRTVEELFGLPLLAGAATVPSLLGHFGLDLPAGSPGPGSSISFVGSAATAGNSTTESVRVPAAAAAGDGLLLVATGANPAPQNAPPGWTLVQQAGSTMMSSSVWQRVAAAGDAGSTVTVSFGGNRTKGSLQLAVYSGTSPAGPVLGAAVPGTGVTVATSFVAPATVAPAPNAWLVGYWAARSSLATAWTVPAGQRAKGSATGSGGGHVTSVLADSDGLSPAGPAGPFTARTNQPASAYIAWTIVLAPSQ